VYSVWREERFIRGFGVETQGKDRLGRTSRRWEDNIKKGLHEV
jgi:hypothetical protein